MKTELTLERAYELAVKKWELTILNDGKDLDVLPAEIERLQFNCSYCEMFFYSTKCIGCPLNLDGEPRGMHGKCKAHKHPYKAWLNLECTETAQAVLDLIIKTKPV